MSKNNFQFEAIGTSWSFDFEIDQSKKSKSAQEIYTEIRSFIEEYEQTFSRFRASSFINQISKTAGDYILPEFAWPLLNLYYQLFEITEKKFTPLIGQTLVEAGYDSNYSLQPKTVTPTPDFSEIIQLKEPKITIKKPVQFDFGAAGKGYLIDLVAKKLLSQYHSPQFLINAGGDIYYYSKNNTSQQVGLENPGDQSQVVGIATIQNSSICGSSGNRRQWQNFHHIINPQTLTSPNKILAVWTHVQESKYSNPTMLADALSTCLFLVSPQELQKKYDFDYLLIFPDYSVEHSPDFPAELFYKNQESK